MTDNPLQILLQNCQELSNHIWSAVDHPHVIVSWIWFNHVTCSDGCGLKFNVRATSLMMAAHESLHESGSSFVMVTLNRSDVSHGRGPGFGDGQLWGMVGCR